MEGRGRMGNKQVSKNRCGVESEEFHKRKEDLGDMTSEGNNGKGGGAWRGNNIA